MTIGRLGVWSWLDHLDYPSVIAMARRVEALGYSSLWIPEAVGRDPFVTLAALAAETDRLFLATGIANIYARDAMAMQAIRHSLDELTGGRLILGLGVSHRELVTGMRQHEYGKPVTTMRTYLQAMAAAFYAGPEVRQQGKLVLAALRPNMLGLAAEQSDGAHPYFVTPEHTVRARDILGDKWLAPMQMVLLETDPAEARRIARGFMSTYIGLENYQNNLRTLGFGDADFADGGSDRLVDAIVAWGDEEALARRIQEHWDAGADHVAMQALRRDGGQGADMELVERLSGLNERR